MITKYRNLVDRVHIYLCHHPNHPILDVHQSHIDNNKLFKARLIAWIYISVIYLWTLWEMASITTNFIYLTLHGYFITWLFYTVVLQDYWLTKIYGKQNHPCKKLKHYIQIIYETALCFQFPITLVFWTFLFPILLRNHASADSIIMNTNLHLGPLVCLLVELYYNNFSFPKRHLWILILYGTGYMIINLAYSLSVKVIYEPIDWKSVLSYLIVIASYLFVVGAFYFGGFWFRKWKAHKLLTHIKEGLIEQQIENKTSAQDRIQHNGRRISHSNSLGAKNNFQIYEGNRKDLKTRDDMIL